MPASVTKQSATGDPDKRAPTQGEGQVMSEELKVDILPSLKESISTSLRQELRHTLSDDFDALKLELQAVRAKMADNMAAVWTKVNMFETKLQDVSSWSDEATRVQTQSSTLKDRCEDVKGRRRRYNI